MKKKGDTVSGDNYIKALRELEGYFFEERPELKHLKDEVTPDEKHEIIWQDDELIRYFACYMSAILADIRYGIDYEEN